MQIFKSWNERIERLVGPAVILFALAPVLVRSEAFSPSVEQLYRHRLLYADRGLAQLSAKANQAPEPPAAGKVEKPRSVAKAAALSLLLPGAGQFYVGDKVRAVPFFLADVGGWITYFAFRSQGKNRERGYRTYADLHYDPQQYINFLINDLGIASGSDYDPVGRRFCRQDDTVNLCVDSGFRFSHHVPTEEGGSLEKNFEYYESIGKYDQFFAGWDDPYLSRKTYREMRAQANNSFSKSKIGLAIAFVDRMAAAVDAALAAKRYNKKMDGTKEVEIGFRLIRYNGARMPKLTATYRF